MTIEPPHFSTVRKGYDPREVDRYVGELRAAIDELEYARAHLEAEVDQLRTGGAPAPDAYDERVRAFDLLLAAVVREAAGTEPLTFEPVVMSAAGADEVGEPADDLQVAAALPAIEEPVGSDAAPGEPEIEDLEVAAPGPATQEFELAVPEPEDELRFDEPELETEPLETEPLETAAVEPARAHETGEVELDAALEELDLDEVSLDEALQELDKVVRSEDAEDEIPEVAWERSTSDDEDGSHATAVLGSEDADEQDEAFELRFDEDEDEDEGAGELPSRPVLRAVPEGDEDADDEDPFALLELAGADDEPISPDAEDRPVWVLEEGEDQGEEAVPALEDLLAGAEQDEEDVDISLEALAAAGEAAAEAETEGPLLSEDDIDSLSQELDLLLTDLDPGDEPARGAWEPPSDEPDR